MAQITYKRNGGRMVELFLPFEFQGRKVDAVTFSPINFGHVLDWQAGRFSTILALMAAVTGESEETLRCLPYPDADRVMAIFVDMLPVDIRETIGERPAVTPQPPPEQPAATAEVPRTNGKEQRAPLPPPWPQPGEMADSQDQAGLGVDLNG